METENWVRIQRLASLSYWTIGSPSLLVWQPPPKSRPDGVAGLGEARSDRAGGLVEHGEVGVDPLDILRGAGRTVRIRRRVLITEPVVPLADSGEVQAVRRPHERSGGGLHCAICLVERIAHVRQDAQGPLLLLLVGAGGRRHPDQVADRGRHVRVDRRRHFHRTDRSRLRGVRCRDHDGAADQERRHHHRRGDRLLQHAIPFVVCPISSDRPRVDARVTSRDANRIGTRGCDPGSTRLAPGARAPRGPSRDSVTFAMPMQYPREGVGQRNPHREGPNGCAHRRSRARSRVSRPAPPARLMGRR